VYIVSNDDWDPVNKAYAEYFGDHKPARVTIPIKELNKGCRVEIEVTAELPE
ncbi:MAG: RidA family protein, partial [Oscillibacter sp.]|nr:RidA family protein [Oscillibacter sp.]